VIGRVSAGQGVIPLWREEPPAYPLGRDHQTTRSLRGSRRAGLVTPVGLRPPCVTSPAISSHPDWRSIAILIVALQTGSSAASIRASSRPRWSKDDDAPWCPEIVALPAGEFRKTAASRRDRLPGSRWADTR